MEPPTARRAALALVVLLAGCAAVGVLDPHRALDAGESRKTVSPELSPSVVWEHAVANTVAAPVETTVRVYPGAARSTLRQKWVHRYDPDARRYRGALFFRNDEGAARPWGTSQLYVGETVTAKLVGESAAPELSRRPVDATTTVEPTFGGFESGRLLPELDADEFAVRRANESHVVLGATDAGSYADLHGLDEERVHDGSSYRAVVERERGRLVRIVDHRVRNRSGDDDVVHRVRTFDYENASVRRPSWATWSPVELGYDALSV